MPNIINRRRKKNKILEIAVNEKTDSDSSCSYDFSSSLNRKYNVLPDDIEINKSVSFLKDEKGEVNEDCKLIRFLLSSIIPNFKVFLQLYNFGV